MWNNRGSRAAAVPHHIRHSEGTKTITIDQREPGGQWVSLGVYHFAPERAAVQIEAQGQGEYIVADAILFAPRAE